MHKSLYQSNIQCCKINAVHPVSADRQRSTELSAKRRVDAMEDMLYDDRLPACQNLGIISSFNSKAKDATACWKDCRCCGD